MRAPHIREESGQAWMPDTQHAQVLPLTALNELMFDFYNFRLLSWRIGGWRCFACLLINWKIAKLQLHGDFNIP